MVPKGDSSALRASGLGVLSQCCGLCGVLLPSLICPFDRPWRVEGCICSEIVTNSWRIHKCNEVCSIRVHVAVPTLPLLAPFYLKGPSLGSMWSPRGPFWHPSRLFWGRLGSYLDPACWILPPSGVVLGQTSFILDLWGSILLPVCAPLGSIFLF